MSAASEITDLRPRAALLLADLDDIRRRLETEIRDLRIELGHGDESDLKTGRCCPHCRHMLTNHNRAVWNAGYETGQRHEREAAVSRKALR